MFINPGPMTEKWIVTRIDGKIASISADYRHLPGIGASLAALPPEDTAEIRTEKVSTDTLADMASSLQWEDLRPIGSAFQIKVWKTLFDLPRTRLYSYTEIASVAGTPLGVRAVAHAIAINPVAYIIPCHLIVPKETMDKAASIRQSAEKTLFRGADLYLLDTIDVGAYAYGADTKRELIKLTLNR